MIFFLLLLLLQCSGRQIDSCFGIIIIIPFDLFAHFGARVLIIALLIHLKICVQFLTLSLDGTAAL